ncbi:zinc finger protein 93-like isoform X9 [Periplaneta americana]|uniref:zinc finger protein 93-like isoform X9 n=1 Tax=Periplaneta americana TaxID=6978 RepID=UPI0037E98016
MLYVERENSGHLPNGEQEGDTSEIMETSIMEGEEYYNQEGGEWTQKVDTGQLCRVCANPNDYLIPIFDGEGLEHELSMKIQKHLPIKVTETDTLPQHMCYQCASTLIAWHDLVISCVEADKKLRELQMEENDDDDDKGGEMFESPSLDSEMTDDVIQPSTSETQNQNQVSKTPSSKKAAVAKEKKSKLKMILVKGPPAGTSGQKTASKTQVAKALELAKSKDGVSQDSASERSEESSEEQLNTFHQSVEGSSLPTCGSNEDGHVIVTPKTEYESHNTCDNLSAYEVFNLSAYEVLGLHKTLHGEGSAVILVKDEDVKDNNNDEDSDNDNDDNPSDTLESSIEQEISSYPYDQLCKILLDRCNADDECYYFSDNSYYYSVEDKKEMVKKEVSVEKFHCQHCGKGFFSAVSFRQHLKIDHTELNELRCISCNDTFESISDLQFHKAVHVRNTGGDGPYLCSVCGKTFGMLSTLKSHERRVHPNHENGSDDSDIKYKCEECGKEFQLQEYLKRHMMKHGEKNFVCETCGKRFETLYILKLHQESHSEVRPYGCKICGSSYKRYRNLLSHRQEVHGIYAIGPRKPKDPLKPRSKSKKGLLKRFPCDVCNKAFSTRGKVAVHMRTHTGERPFRCDTCGNTYPYSSSLYVHRKVVHEGRQRVEKGSFLCNVCNKTFSTRNYLDVHRRTHTGEKPYVCTVCNRAFSQRTSLINHTALHTDARPYDCTFCNKAFRRRETLLVHIRTHTGEKPYVCEICNRGFAQLTDMKKHRLKIHNAPPLKRR